MFVAGHVLRASHQNKADIMAAVSAWRKMVAENARDFVRSRMICVNDLIDSGTRHFVSWLENVRRCPSSCLPQHEQPPQLASADREECRSLAIISPRRGRSPSGIAVNFSPSPLAGSTWRTTASALTCPSWTRKSTVAAAPKGLDVRVLIKRPPKLRSLTGETSSRPLQLQYTDTPSSISMREVRLLEKEGLRTKRSIRHPVSCRYRRGSNTTASTYIVHHSTPKVCRKQAEKRSCSPHTFFVGASRYG